jgi:AraC-like DNA-binding protein
MPLLCSPSVRDWKDLAMSCRDDFFQYLPVDEDAMNRGLYVTGAGRATIRPGESYPPSGHPALYEFEWARGRTLPEYQLLLFTDGAGEFESESTGTIRFEGLAQILLLPGVWHRYRPVPDVGWTERWLSFNGEIFHRLFDAARFGRQLTLWQPRNARPITEEFDKLLDAVRGQSVPHTPMLTFQALKVVSAAVAEGVEEGLAAGIMHERASKYFELTDPVVQRALELIWSHGQHPMSVSEIAKQLPVTRRTLDRRFVEATGHSVLDEINVCRLSRAKRLLVETELPVKTVARLAGFSSTERLRVLFVEREGMSPTVYRRKATGVRSQA